MRSNLPSGEMAAADTVTLAVPSFFRPSLASPRATLRGWSAPRKPVHLESSSSRWWSARFHAEADASARQDYPAEPLQPAQFAHPVPSVPAFPLLSVLRRR